jgi:tRNA(Ile)-lysidine synthase TilS/MesJ
MKTLNERYQYGLQLFLLSIDEGITGYRDDSLEVSNQWIISLRTPRLNQ